MVKQAHLSGLTGCDRSRQSFATMLRELFDRIGVDGRRVTLEAGLGYGERMIKVHVLCSRRFIMATSGLQQTESCSFGEACHFAVCAVNQSSSRVNGRRERSGCVRMNVFRGVHHGYRRLTWKTQSRTE
jgi:hypothetical protein